MDLTGPGPCNERAGSTASPQRHRPATLVQMLEIGRGRPREAAVPVSPARRRAPIAHCILPAAARCAARLEIAIPLSVSSGALTLPGEGRSQPRECWIPVAIAAPVPSGPVRSTRPSPKPPMRWRRPTQAAPPPLSDVGIGSDTRMTPRPGAPDGAGLSVTGFATSSGMRLSVSGEVTAPGPCSPLPRQDRRVPSELAPMIGSDDFRRSRSGCRHDTECG